MTGAPIGLGDRSQLLERLRDAVARARPFAVLVIELDRASDADAGVLDDCAARLIGAVRRGDLVASSRGGEFVVVLDDIGAGADLAARVHAARCACERPFAAGGEPFDIGARVGVACYPGDGTDIHTLLGHAGAAAAALRDALRHAMPRSGIRLLLVDDHALMREGLRSLLARAADIDVVGEASDGIEALERLRRQAVDIVVTDLAMPRLSGLDLVRSIRSEFPAVAVIALTMHDEEHYAVGCFRAGARGFLNKDSVGDELIAAVRRVASGGSYVTATLAGRVKVRGAA